MPSAADWNELHADPLQATVTTGEATTSTTYTNLATSGPAVTKTLVSGQKVLVMVSSTQTHPAGMQAWMAFEVTGASGTIAASDTDAATSDLTTNAVATVSQWTVFTASATGSHTFTAKYRTQGTSVTFSNRRIIIKPF